MTGNKIILSITAFVGIVTYLFWDLIGCKIFYTGNAIFITLLCLFIFIQNRGLFISFFLLCISVNNLLDELFFNPTTLGLNEIIFAISLPFIWLLKYSKHAGKISTNRIVHFFNKNNISCIFSCWGKIGNRNEKK